MFGIIIIVFIYGLLVGSFLNVVIYRVPRNKSVISPRSSCPHCDYKIKWYENIPVFSYIFLKGKCRGCSSKISIRYPLIELLIGLIALMLFPSSLEQKELINFFFEFSIACIFVAHFMIDIEHQLLPDKLNLYLLAFILPYSIMLNNPMDIILGAVIGFGGPFLITYLFYKFRGQIGLGGGDIKLFGILGLLLGPEAIVHTIFFSSFFGAILGILFIALSKMNKNNPLAFGPYILIVASLQIFMPSIFSMINIFKL